MCIFLVSVVILVSTLNHSNTWIIYRENINIFLPRILIVLSVLSVNLMTGANFAEVMRYFFAFSVKSHDIPTRSFCIIFITFFNRELRFYRVFMVLL